MSEEPAGPENNVGLFKANFKLLIASAAHDADVLDTMVKVTSWIKWIRGGSGSQDHNNYFFMTALHAIAKALLKRRLPDPAAHIPPVQDFFRYCLLASSDHISKDLLEVTRMAHLILNRSHMFYLLYGRPEPSASAAEVDAAALSELGADTAWADDVNQGDFVDFFNDAGAWVSALVKEVSPTHTEFQVQEDGKDPKWLSLDDERLAPLGQGGKRKTARTDSVQAQLEAASKEEWRQALHRGVMCDGLDIVKKWYQCVVVDERDNDGVSEVKVNFLGWGYRFDEWIARTSLRLAPLNSRSYGRRGSAYSDTVLSDQELIVTGDEADPAGVAAVARPGLDRSQYLIDNLNYYLVECHGAKRTLTRIAHAEVPVPLRIIVSDLLMLSSNVGVLAKPFLAEFMPPYFEHVSRIVRSLSEDDLRHLSKDMVFGLMRSLRILLRRIKSRSETGHITESLYLDVAEKCLRCQQLERRLNGINYLQLALKATTNAKLYPDGLQTSRWTDETGKEQSQHLRMECSDWMTPEFMSGWLLEHKVLEDIFVERKHVQLMKRSVDILRFLAVDNKLSTELFDAVWAASRSAFHDQAVAVKSLLGNLAGDLPAPLLEQLYRQMSSIPYHELNDEDIALIGRIATSQHYLVPEPADDSPHSVTPQLVASRCAKSAVDLLWNISQSTSASPPVAPAIISAAVSKLEREVLRMSAMEPLRMEYIEKCINNVATHKNVAESLKLLHGIIDGFPVMVVSSGTSASGSADSEPEPEPWTQGTLITHLDSTKRLVDVLLEDTLVFKKAASSAAAAVPASVKDRDAAINALSVAGSSSSYLDDVRARLDAIAYILSQSSLSLSPAQATTLWDQFYTGSLSAEERSMSLAWFSQACDALVSQAAGKAANTRFSHETAAHLFTTRMADSEFAQRLTPAGFNCLKTYFVFVNSLSGRIVHAQDKTSGASSSALSSSAGSDFTVMDLNLQGSDVLWAIALEAANEVTVSMAVEFLTSLQQRLCSSLKAVIGDYRRAYIKRCMDCIASAAATADPDDTTLARIERCLGLLDALLDEAEAETRSRGFDPHSPELGAPSRVFFSCNIKTPAGGTLHAKKTTFGVYSNERGYDVKSAMGQLLGLSNEHFRLHVQLVREICGALLGRTVADLGLDPQAHLLALTPLSDDDVKKGDGSAAAAIAAAIFAAETADSKAADESAAESDSKSADGSGADDKGKGDEEEAPVPVDDLPAVILSGNDAYFSSMFQLLTLCSSQSVGSTAVRERVLAKCWQLLGRLPSHDGRRSALTTLKPVEDAGGDGSAWKGILDPSSPFILLYSLQSLQSLLTDPARLEKHRRSILSGRLPPGALEGKAGPAAADGSSEAANSSANASGAGAGAGAGAPSAGGGAGAGASAGGGAGAGADADADASASAAAGASEAGASSAEPDSASLASSVTPEQLEQWRSWQLRFLSLNGFQHLYSCLVSTSGPVAAVLGQGSASRLMKKAAVQLLNVVRYFTLGAMAARNPDSQIAQLAGGSEEAGPDGTSKPDSTIPDLDSRSLVDILRGSPAGTTEAILSVIDWSVLHSTLVRLMALVRRDDGTCGPISHRDAEVITTAATLWVAAVVNSPALWGEFLGSPDAGVLLSLLTAGEGDGASHVRQHMVSCLRLLTSLVEPQAKSNKTSQGHPHPHEHVLTQLLSRLPSHVAEGGTPPATRLATGSMVEFFDLAAHLLHQSCQGRCGGSAGMFAGTLRQLVAHIRTSPVLESRHSTAVDSVLVGALNLTAVLVSASPELREQVGSRQPGSDDLIRYLFHDCLFALPNALPSPALASGDATSAAEPEEDADVFGQQELPKCKTTEARTAAFGLLSALCRGSWNNTLEFDQTFMDIFKTFDPPNCYKYDPRLSKKADCGFVGLRNLGCICYMNSFMQQFFMIKPLRYGVLSAPVHAEADPEERKEDVLYQLQRMFGHLYMSERRAYDPAPWCHAYKDESGKPTNYFIQQDAQEYFNVLCDRVEHGLKGTPQEKLIQSIFTGAFSNQLLCMGGCNSVRTRPETFYCISLQVQHKRNLQESLEHMIKGEVISDFNCESCDKKSDVTKRVCIDSMNNTVIFHLKRFELNYETFMREKLNDRFEFPTELDLYPYCTEGLDWAAEVEAAKAAKKAKAASAGNSGGGGDGEAADGEASAGAGAGAAGGSEESAAGGSAGESAGGGVDESKSSGGDQDSGDAAAAGNPSAGGDDDSDLPPRPYKLHPKEYYEYELVGVVVHMGTAESGHYSSYIRERGDTPEDLLRSGKSKAGIPVAVEQCLEMEPTAAEVPDRAEGARRTKSGQWFEFNDSLVQPFDIEKLPEATFGGSRKMRRWSMYLQRSLEVDEPISHNAYMLFYERKNPLPPEASSGADEAASNAGSSGDASASEAAGSSKDVKSEKVDPEAAQLTTAGAASGGGGAAPAAEALRRDTTGMMVLDKKLRPWVPPSIADDVLSDNLEFLQYLNVYSPEFSQFAVDYCKDLVAVLPPVPAFPEDPNAPNPGLVVISHMFEFATTVFVRTANTNRFVEFANAMGPLLENNVPAAAYILDMCLHKIERFKDAMLRCSVAQIRKAFADLLLKAISALSKFETPHLSQTVAEEKEVPAPPSDEDGDAKDGETPRMVTITIERHTTATGRFMNVMMSTSMLDYVVTAWKHFDEYFGLLLNFAKMGRPQRVFCEQRSLSVLLFDLYLCKDSPVYGPGAFIDSNTRRRIPMGNKQYSPTFTNMLATAILLVRCYYTAPVAQKCARLPPTTIIHMDETDEEIIARQHREVVRTRQVVPLGDDSPWPMQRGLSTILMHEALFTKALKCGDAPHAMADLVAHLCWDWPEFSHFIVAQVILPGLEAADFDEVHPFFHVLEAMFGLDDGLMGRRYQVLMHGVPPQEEGGQHVGGLISCMEAFSNRFPRFTYEAVHGLIRLMHLYPEIGSFIAEEEGVFEWMERFLREHIASPKNATFKSPLTIPPPLPSRAEQARLRGLLLQHPSQITFMSDFAYCRKLKLSEAERASRSLVMLEQALSTMDLTLLGEEEIIRRMLAEKEAAAAAAAAASAAAASTSEPGDADSSSDGMDLSSLGGVATLDDEYTGLD